MSFEQTCGCDLRRSRERKRKLKDCITLEFSNFQDSAWKKKTAFTKITNNKSLFLYFADQLI